MQLMIGIVYLGAAFTKMHTPAFFSSDQMLHWLMTNVNNSNPVGEYLSFYPATLVVSAYITILWEVLFVFIAWRGWNRSIMIGLGIFFHLGTTFLLGLYIFPLVCFSVYASFLYEEDVQRFAAFFKRLEQRGNRLLTKFRSLGESIGRAIPEVSPRQASLVFGAVVLFVTFGGVGVEYQCRRCLAAERTRSGEGRSDAWSVRTNPRNRQVSFIQHRLRHAGRCVDGPERCLPSRRSDRRTVHAESAARGHVDRMQPPRRRRADH
jgi:hypothetical protein